MGGVSFSTRIVREGLSGKVTLRKDLKEVREGAPQGLGEEHSRQRERQV